MGKMPCWNRTLPRPPHAGQPSGWLPGAEPLPWQALAVDHLDVVGDLLLAAERRFLVGDGELDAEISLVALADASEAEQIAENSVDRDVADVDDASRKRAVPARSGEAASPPHDGRSGRLVHGSAVRVAQHLIRGVELLEADDGGRIIRVLVGVVLGGQLAEGHLDLFVRRNTRDAEHLVMVALRHR